MIVISEQGFGAFEPPPEARFVRWWFERQSLLGAADPAMLDAAYKRFVDEASFAGVETFPAVFEYVAGRIFMPHAQDELYVTLLNIVSDYDLPQSARLQSILDLARTQAPT